MPKEQKRGIENLGLKTIAVFSISVFILLLCLIRLNVAIKTDYLFNSGSLIVHSQLLDRFMFAIVDATSITNTIIFSFFLLFAFIISRRWSQLSMFVLGLATAFFLEFLTKIIIHRPRPEDALISLKDFSFPSGHATLSAFLFIFMIYAFKNDFKDMILRKIFITFCISAILIISYSRVYLNLHWFSDAIGGLVLGIFSFSLFASYLHTAKS